jgi:hypothetical protein
LPATPFFKFDEGGGGGAEGGGFFCNVPGPLSAELWQEGNLSKTSFSRDVWEIFAFFIFHFSYTRPYFVSFRPRRQTMWFFFFVPVGNTTFSGHLGYTRGSRYGKVWFQLAKPRDFPPKHEIS